jgi:hypothetical protein
MSFPKSILPLSRIPRLVRPSDLAKAFPFVKLKFTRVPTAIAVLDNPSAMHHVLLELACIHALLLFPVKTPNACSPSILPLPFVAVAIFHPDAFTQTIWNASSVVTVNLLFLTFEQTESLLKIVFPMPYVLSIFPQIMT